MADFNPKEHSMDLKVLAHVCGVDEARKAIADAQMAVDRAIQALKEITVEMDVE